MAFSKIRPRIWRYVSNATTRSVFVIKSILPVLPLSLGVIPTNLVDMYALEQHDFETEGHYRDIVYWKTIIPNVPFLKPRDYVFRRHTFRHTYQCSDIWMVIDQSVPHADIPRTSKIVRVDSYNRVLMVEDIKDDQGQNHVRFMVTYLKPLDLDFPIPNFLFAWMAGNGMAMFVKNLAKALRDYDAFLKNEYVPKAAKMAKKSD